MTRNFVVIVLLLLFCYDSNAQDTLRGKIYDIQSDSILSGCRIRNLTKKTSVNQYQNGNYTIIATAGDSIQFYTAGFRADTIIVQLYMLNTGYDISLAPESVLLPGVTIEAYNNYRSDSLAQREYYAESFKKQTPLTGYNRPNDGVGVSLSPFSYFSQEAKQKRKLQKKLIEDEKQAYIDFSFPRDYIQRLTNLHGDSLNIFMRRYRPTYEFCKNKSREEMLMYINTSLIQFKKEMIKPIK